MYANGRGGLPKDDAQALSWFRKAAEQGNAFGQNSLGFMYENGRGGLPKDEAQALSWYRKAAEQGYASAQYNLGGMYENGLGVPKDESQAISWYRKAADQGDASAKTALSRIQDAKTSTPAVTETRSPTRTTIPLANNAQQLVLGTQYALIIGNKKYQYLKPLITPHDDVDAIESALVRYGFEKKNITVIKDAKRSDIIGALATLRAQLTATDNLLIYYAGHGRIDNETQRGYWLPIDAGQDEANWVSNDDITNYLKAMHARSVLVVSDSCYSGALTRADAKPIRVGGADEWVRRMADKRSRTALTSGGLEPVLDGGGGKYSVFAKAFIDVLQANTRPNTMEDLALEIKRKVVVNSPQTPLYGDIRFAGHDDGDFVLVPR
jgi:TPR repeat protein